MFLKIHFNNSIKKIKFKDEYNDFQSFMKFLSEFLNQNPETIEVFFYDAEKDKINVKDALDWEYFVDHYQTEKFANVHVVLNEDGKKEVL